MFIEQTETSDSVRIQVGNLSSATTEPQIRAMFLPFGPVQFYDRPRNEHTQQPGPLAYVDMALTAAEAALKALQGVTVHGEAVTVTKASPLPAWVLPAERGPRSPRPRRTVTPYALTAAREEGAGPNA